MSKKASRILAVIVHADVVGSTTLVQINESVAHERIQEAYRRFSETIKLYNGTALEIRGDALVAKFSRASDALCAALSFQVVNNAHIAGLTDDVRPVIRIGIAMGEVVVADRTVTGDGVVMAQRLEQLADPGGVVIQGAAYETVPKRFPFDYTDLGEVELKGFDSPSRAFFVSSQSMESIPAPEPQTAKGFGSIISSGQSRILAGLIFALVIIGGGWYISSSLESTKNESAHFLTEAKIPSLLVLPFINNSNDQSQDYFVDGISEDIVTDFSRLSNLTVLAWNTSKSFKGKLIQPKEIGEKLGVSYILSGSVRKSGNQLRITAELVDASSGNQLWGDRYDRKVTDVFALQDEVTRKIVDELAVRLTVSEEKKLGHSGTDNFAAYDLFLHGQQYAIQRTKEGNNQARDAFRKAIDLDPSFARAYGALAILLTRDYRNNWSELSLAEARARALELAQKAVSLDPASPQAYWALGYVNLLQRNYDNAAKAAEKSVKLAPGYADGYGLLAYINNSQGHAHDAVRHIARAMSLNPYYTYEYPSNLGRAYYVLGEYSKAVGYLKDAIQRNENVLHPHLFLAAAYVRLGQQDDAEWEINQLEIMHPGTTISLLSNTLAIQNRQQLDALLDDLRKAGIPDS